MPSARPILFSAPMVRALLAGTKTQTRRLVKPQDRLRQGKDDLGRPGVEYLNEWGSWQPWVNNAKTLRCPYGKPGDLLWVRETWAVSTIYDGVSPRDVPQCGVRYAASEERLGIKDRPSIFMPRWASRLTLEITEVRVQRLEDISEQDAIAEGVVKIRDCCHVIRDVDYDLVGLCHTSPITPYAKLWDTLNGDKPGMAWADNPWVWALTFRVHSANVDAVLAAAKEPV